MYLAGHLYPRGVTTAKQPLAPMAAQTTPENPWPIALLAQKVREYVGKMSSLWVEAQVVEYNPRPGARMAYFVVRDINADASFNVKAYPNVIDAAGAGFTAGSKVVLQVKPDFWEVRGSLSLHCNRIIIQGEGQLLAQLDQLRRKLASEGLFNKRRALPFIPKKIGLICGRNAKAKEDVIVNAQVRWPGTNFEVREVAVQGANAVKEVSAALRELDAHPGVDVIIITRGGGSVEDLLPFSDESLVRLGAATKTPLISAIGHEDDAPLLDLVADYRASTPTDAARHVVPDWNDLNDDLVATKTRLQRAILRRLTQERENLNLLAALCSPAPVSPCRTAAPNWKPRR